jgi:hypothetical protein
MKINKLAVLFAVLVSLSAQCFAQELPEGYVTALGKSDIYVVHDSPECTADTFACADNCCESGEECKSKYNRKIEKIESKCTANKKNKASVRNIPIKCNYTCRPPAICAQDPLTGHWGCYGKKPDINPPKPPTPPKPPVNPPGNPPQPKPPSNSFQCGYMICNYPQICRSGKCI